MDKRQKFVVTFGILVSAVFLWFAFRDLKPDEVIHEIKQANIILLLFGAAWYFAAVSIITLRWQFLLRSIKFVNLKHLIPLVCIGYMGNNVYPFRSGEALRIFLLQKNHDVPVIKATTTVIVERVFDGLVMLTFIIVSLMFTDIVSSEIQNIVNVTAPLFIFALLVFFMLAARPNILHQLLEFVSQFLPTKLSDVIEHLGEDIIKGLESLRSPIYLAGTIISSYVTWGLEASVYWIVMQAFGIEANYYLALLVVGAVNLAGLVPASPGNLGTYEFFASLVLIAADIEPKLAAGYAVTVHLVIWLPVTLVGFFFLLNHGLGWQAITQAHKTDKNSTVAT